jgi:hypothetical protein
MLDNQNPKMGIELALKEGEKYQDSKYYSIKYKLYCVRNQIDRMIITDIVEDGYEFVISAKSPHACPFIQVSAVWAFIRDNNIIFGLILLAIGLSECFFGLRMLNPTLFVIGYFTGKFIYPSFFHQRPTKQNIIIFIGFGILVLLFAEFLITPTTHIILVWVALLLAVVCGALIGYLAMTLPKLGFFALGMWLGFVLALMLNNAFLYKIEVDPPQLILYIVMFIF